MATYGDKAREQDDGQMFSRRLLGDGHVPRTDGFHTILTPAQPTLQRDGRPPEPELDGLSVAAVLRFVSALQLNIVFGRAVLTGTLIVWCRKLVEQLISGDNNHMLRCVVECL